VKSSNPPLPQGFSPVPPGKIVSAVTCLEMRERPSRAEAAAPAGLALTRLVSPDLDAYRSLFRAIGEDWLWSSRLERSDEALRALTDDPLVEIYVLSRADVQIGLLELDFRQAGDCELVFLGVIGEAIGTGAGSFLMERALSIAWSHPIERFWLHTCHLDHLYALDFYQRFGFKPTSRWVEVFDDPRLTGVFPRSAAPRIPILDV
jgi:GNAT superfamily N-acetyltransferase